KLAMRPHSFVCGRLQTALDPSRGRAVRPGVHALALSPLVGVPQRDVRRQVWRVVRCEAAAVGAPLRAEHRLVLGLRYGARRVTAAPVAGEAGAVVVGAGHGQSLLSGSTISPVSGSVCPGRRYSSP